MSYLYHSRPQNLTGDVLYPLNQLRTLHPEIYDEAVNKYAGREHLLRAQIPLLKCFWNDVVHLSPIHPTKIRGELEKLGGTFDSQRKWLRIPTTALANLPSVYFSRAPSGHDDDYEFAANNFLPFVMSEYHELSAIPQWTIDWYRMEIARGARPLLFNGVTHVLAHGAISLREATEIIW